MRTTKGTLLVWTGPSGVGKGTVLQWVMEREPNLYFSISATTRAPRPGEVDGQHYHFLSRGQFDRYVQQDAFLEYATYVDNSYGTLEEPVQQALDAGRDVVLEIEVQGAQMVKRRRPDAVLVFVAPPSFAQLEQRLRGRGTETDEKIAKRLETARQELRQAAGFDYIVVNDQIEQAGRELMAILLAERCRSERRKMIIEVEEHAQS